MKNFKVIRYFIVIVAAAALVLGAVFIPRFNGPEKDSSTQSGEESYGTETKIADNDTQIAPETTEFRTDPPETDDPDAIKDAVDEEFIPAKEDTNGYTGLRGFFVHKLVTDPEKVELYLNIRETPSMSGKILYVIYPDDIVTYTG
ncbi:MAG: hypothetical protein II601_07535, partial [Lachnospiraceae bacterium]|nr:hypothetical protein [Lachnospiraceae bacterium]